MPQETYIPIILALTELVKRMGMPARLAPVAAIVLGVVMAFLGAGMSMSAFSIEQALQGLVWGLSASGLWSGGKAIIGK